MAVWRRWWFAISLALCAAAASVDAAGDAAKFPLDSIDQRVQPCMACHGDQGRATNDGYYPRIAGKPAGYLYNQLLNFRAGRRRYAMMTYLTERQDEAYLREIATYFAGLHPPYPAPQSPAVEPDVLARGQAIVTAGDATHGVPACQACHGARLTGVLPSTPGLLGLSHDYLMGQLGAWRIGNREALAPDCMHEIVQRLAPADLYAAAAWLASQRMPDDPTPATPAGAPLPMVCGSVPASTTVSP